MMSHIKDFHCDMIYIRLPSIKDNQLDFCGEQFVLL